MIEPLPEFAGPLFRLSHADDPPTSKQAIKSLEASGVRETHRAVVLAAVRRYPSRTAMELMDLTGLKEYQVRRRLTDLKIDKLVDRCASRTCSVQGSSMVTWRAF